MAIDPTIYNLANKPAVKLESYSDLMGQRLQAKGMMQAQEMRGMQMDEQRQSMADVMQQRQDVVESGGDLQKLQQARLAKGDLKGASEINTMQKAKEAEALAKQAAEIKKYGMWAQQTAQILSTVKDEPTYQAAKQQLAEMAGTFGVDTNSNQMPPNFDPQFVASKVQQATSINDQMKEKWLQNDKAMKQASQDETARHNRAMESTAVRGQNMAAAKSEALNNGPKAPGFKETTTLRKEYNDQSKNYKTVQDSMSRIDVAAKNDTAASDLNLIFAYMKMLDPNSAVKEGEFATAANSASVPDKIRAAYNKAATGERLAPNTKADFVNQAKQLYAAASTQQNGVTERYRSIAERAGMDPANVIAGDAPKSNHPAASTMKEGTVSASGKFVWKNGGWVANG